MPTATAKPPAQTIRQRPIAQTSSANDRTRDDGPEARCWPPVVVTRSRSPLEHKRPERRYRGTPGQSIGNDGATVR
jgi:hypothetical protein